MELMAIRKRVQLKTLPCGIPFSTKKASDICVPIRTLMNLLDRKLIINLGKLPTSLRRDSALWIEYLQSMSYAFSMSKNTAIIYSLFKNVSWIALSSLTKQSIVE
ncbi:unnamed protein product [Meganyctiphanes norvegica]|uniref:Uncharacterized protein n=1 Tax=Meganyctiphanes norvegica TaxID=48144 RepID=A0AAV2SXX6_MEGNR